jgi:PKD repeat protein
MGFEFVTALEQRRLFSVTAHIRVLNNETTIEAGQSVHVSALAGKKGVSTNFGSGDAVSSKIQWNFNDPSGLYNKLPGFNAAHVYETPGKYKVTLRVTNDQGQTDTASRVIKVVAPSYRRIYVNPWGNDANSGKAPGTAVKTITRAMQLVGNNTELLFRRGQTFSVTSAMNIPFSNVVVGAYGKGKTPKLVLKTTGNQYSTMFGMTDASHQITIENLLLESNGANAYGDAIHAAGSNIVISGCDFENLDSAIIDSGSPQGVLAYNNSAGTLRSYFAFVKGSDQAFLGNSAGDSTKQHNIRIYGSRILCYGNDLTNLPEGASLATLRVNDGTDIYWSSNVLHGGQIYVGPLGPASAGSTANQSVSNVVIENNRWKEVPGHWSANDRVEIQPGTSGVMIRNNFIDATNSAAINVSTYSIDKFGKKTVDRTVSGVEILSNTVVNNGTNGAFLSVGGGQQRAITLKDSLYVAPDLNVGPNANAAVRVTGRNDLLNFTTLSSGGGIDGNVWNLPARAKSMGVNYVSADNAGPSGYRTPSEWLGDFPGVVGDDAFEKLLARNLNKVGAPPVYSGAATFAVPAQGVFADLEGNSRPKKKWTAGALQTL